MGKQELLFSRIVEMKNDSDVVILGGGPSGFIAAIAAARGGARTAIIERYGFFGGMATAGLVAPISVFCYNGELVQGGIPWEFVKRLEAIGGAQVEKPLGNISFSPELYKVVSAQMLEEAGVDMYLYTEFIDCEVEERKIQSVILHNKGGLFAVTAKVFIDCTGDGDLAYLAGVPMLEQAKELQPASLIFAITGIDFEKFPKMHHALQGVNYYLDEAREVLLKRSTEEEMPVFGGPWMCFMMNDSTVLINMTRKYVNMINPEEATNAACRLREEAFQLCCILRETVPGFEACELLYTAPQTGIRETRHIKGIHTLTGEEFITGVHFEDAVGRSSHPVDIHAANDAQQTCDFLKQAGYIPYRALIAEDFPNLIVPCRAFSADKIAFASCRVQAPLMGLGQAAGYAAAMCAKNDIPVQDVDILELRAVLIKVGAII